MCPQLVYTHKECITWKTRCGIRPGGCCPSRFTRIKYVISGKSVQEYGAAPVPRLVYDQQNVEIRKHEPHLGGSKNNHLDSQFLRRLGEEYKGGSRLFVFLCVCLLIFTYCQMRERFYQVLHASCVYTVRSSAPARILLRVFRFLHIICACNRGGNISDPYSCVNFPIFT